ncbi:hypothetical protein [Lysobacter arvi]|uniref:Uncharacterized protein n=1 Tax=Lysobacter arvi TaxID=3038776 RepID=A0ABU1CDQ9_9GAMM|nr:hypothetical protein [Lysobacter arvi]MDR0183225.1 hypothetical protein [Lysobacter arvi]
MLKDARDLFFFDATSKTWSRKYKGLPPFPHYELAGALKAIFDADRAEVPQRGGVSVYVQDLRVHADRCEGLISVSNPNAADPTLNDRPKRKRRVINKVGDEGVEHSAHFLWHYGSKTNSNSCPFFLEVASGLASSVVVRFINRLLREYVGESDSFTLPDPSGVCDKSGNPVQIKTRPNFGLIGHPSAAFLHDLKKGELSDIELYTEINKNGSWDSHGYTLEDRRSIHIKPNKEKHLPKAKGLLDGVLTKDIKAAWEYARVSGSCHQ